MAKAPDIKLFSGSSNLKLAKDIGQRLGVELGNIQLKRFPDNEIAIEILDDVYDKQVYVVQSIAIKPNEYLMELLVMVDALKRASARKIIAVIPYLGYSRQDRQDKPNVPITAKLVADLLQTAGVDAVITADLHSEQIEGFFDIPVENLHCMPLLLEELKNLKPKNLIVATQDVGSIKLVSGYANQLHVGMAIINKQRLSDQKVHTLEIIGDVKEKDVLLADDMCSTGATLASAAKACQEKGAKRILACISHGLFVGDAYKQISQSPIEALITTDTVPFKGPEDETTISFHVVSSAPIFAEAIKRRF